MTHIMCDLETRDTAATAAVLSIGLCVVDFATGEVRDPFYIVVDQASCDALGLTESQATRTWWDRQSAEARKCWTDPGVSLQEAMLEVNKYLSKYGFKYTHVWGNGSDFDNAIMANLYSVTGVKMAWPFWNNRCFRTMKSISNHKTLEPVRAGTHHNALDDAEHQGRWLINIDRHCGGIISGIIP